MAKPEGHRFSIYILITFLLGAISFTVQAHTSQTQYITKVHQLEESSWQDAVNHLIVLRDSLNQLGQHDPEVGFETIRILTEHKQRRHYRFASEMYYWGLQGDEVSPYRQSINNEIERLKPILTDETYSRWIDLLNRDNPLVLREIMAFWLDRDLTPNSLVNERLLEHWERIAYARENFTERNTTVYETDDRGPIYVKYGQPDRVIDGVFTLEHLKLDHWLEMMKFSAGSTTISSTLGRVQDSYISAVQTVHDDPKYTVWLYRNLDGNIKRLENTIYIFGGSPNTGYFRQRDSLEEFIPSRAYNIPRPATGITAANLLQLAYYDQLAYADIYFATTFGNLEANAQNLRQESHAQSELYRSNQENKQDLQRIQANAPVEVSEEEESLFPITLEYRYARLLDQNSDPVLWVFTYSNPYGILLAEHLKASEQEQLQPDFQLTHNIRLRNEQQTVLANISDQQQFPEGFMEHISEDALAQSIFMIPHQRNNPEVRLSVLLEDLNKNRTKRDQYLYPESVLAAHRRQIKTSKPLIPDQNDIFISDLIVGYGNIDHSELGHVPDEEEFQIPFYVPAQNIIPKEHGLSLFFETYNISTDENNTGRYVVSYQLKPKKWLQFLSTELETSLILNQTSRGTRNRDVLEIDIAHTEPGEYILEIIVTDSETEVSARRNITLEITG